MSYRPIEQQEEEGELLQEDESYAQDSHPMESDELHFSRFITKLIQCIPKACHSNHGFLRGKQLHYHLQLCITLIIYLSAMIIGSVYLNHCNNELMICIFLIVQGVCGLFVVLVHICAAAIDCTSMNTMTRSKLAGNLAKCTFALAHILVLFSIIWFIMGHIWIFGKTDVSHNEKTCHTRAPQVGVMTIVLEYMFGIWYLCSYIWNSPSILLWLQTTIKYRLDPMTLSRIPPTITEPSNNETDQAPMNAEPTNSSALVSYSGSSCTVRFLLGLIVSGILLLVTMIVFFNPSTPSAGSSTINLPIQCFTYISNVDLTRLHTYESCCQEDRSLTTGWYRFMGNGGTRLVSSPLKKTSICGASYPGWWNGTLPMVVGTTNLGNVCFYDGNSICTNPITPISATNCGEYHVFYLITIPCCTSYRYCTTF